MRALLRKDLRWIAFLAGTGLLIHLWIQADDDAAAIWIYPMEQYGWMSLGFHAIAATVLGLLATVSDELTQTQEYLIHRPVSAARLFWTRQLGGAIVLATWVVLVPALHLAGCLLLRADTELVDGSRYWLFLAEGTPAFLFYGLAVFSGSVVRRPFLALLLAAATNLTALLFLLLLLFAGSTSAATTVLSPIVCLGAAGLLLAGAERVQRRRPDPDRPWTAVAMRWAAPLLVALVALGSSALLTAGQLASRRMLLASYPMVVDQAGRAVLAVDSHRGLYEVGEQHDRVRPLVADDLVELWRPVWLGPDPDDIRVKSSRFPREGWPFRGGFCNSRSGASDGRHTFVCSDGYVHLVRTVARRDRGLERPAYQRLGLGPENRPVPESASWFGDNGMVVIFDPHDRGLWLLDTRALPLAFTRIDLPGGDRFVTFARVAVRRDRYQALRRPRAAVFGERGAYLWLGDHFAAAPSDVDAEPVESRPRATTAASGPAVFSLTLHDRQGRTIFTHDYRPHTGTERALAFLTVAPSVLRPPIIAALSPLATRRAFALRPSLLLDQTVAAGERRVLIPLALLAVLLAVLTHFRLRRWGTSPVRRRFWVCAVLLGGPPVFLCELLLETRRAWQPMPAEPQRQALSALLIQSAP